MLRNACILLIIGWLSLPAKATDAVNVFIRDDVYQNYLQFLSGRDVKTISEFSGQFIRRDVVDMIIAQQALALGGVDISFEYYPGKLNFRNTRMLQQGKLLISFDTYWLLDAKAISEDVFISQAVIRRGEYYAGIFASPTHPSIFSLKNVDELERYTAVSTPRWRTDWKTLSDLPIKALFEEDSWVSQARMVEKQLVDFFLMPFHATVTDTYTMDSVTLKPVKGIAVLLDDSRHFVISRQHPRGEEAYNAIEKGLSRMREEGRISRAYREAGFLIDSSKVTVINAPSL